MKRILELIKDGQLNQIIEIPVKPADIYHKVKEMIIFKGDDVIPVLEFDDVKISEQKGSICTQLQEFMFDNAEKDAIPISEFLQLIDTKSKIGEQIFQKEVNQAQKPSSQFKFEINDSNILNQSKDSNNQNIYRIRSSSCCNDLILNSQCIEEEKHNNN
eukprot:TRINITY_DN6080_c0_g1_i3.p2 TRINITY_DN6080_c0_g1~~TRINITY_DN6080_c0_g1_i3.p2  ORF type:complete len:159 (-),score=22.54 TRINITY_DN6080_c0_g1_i3:183-659(-)